MEEKEEEKDRKNVTGSGGREKKEGQRRKVIHPLHCYLLSPPLTLVEHHAVQHAAVRQLPSRDLLNAYVSARMYGKRKLWWWLKSSCQLLYGRERRKEVIGMCDCCTKCVETPLQMSEKSSKTEVHTVLKTSDSIQQLQNMLNASITPQ